MARALSELAREAEAEVLFDQGLVRNKEAGPIRGRLAADAALTALLAGSGVGFRVTPDGAFVLFAIPAARPPSEGDGAIAELLVVGRRTQNADIRRTQNDIQNYKVADRRAIEASQRDNIEQYLRSREPSNVEVRPPTQDPLAQPGSTRSEIDLRGFGPQRTLVLIDGRRLPSLPSGQGEFDQPDLNGVPPGAVERIETLTSTAGGIYGPGAIGGVVNVVLRRDYRGADLNIATGIADRGDAGHVRVEARLGFTPDHGDTDVMLFAAYAASQPLLVGQRDFAQAARARAYANDPAGYMGRFLAGDAVSVLGSENLIFDAAQGGASIGSFLTFLPIDFTGTVPQRAAVLAANAGRVVLSLPDDQSGTRRYLLNNPTVTSLIFSVRRRFGDIAEVYLDGLYLDNDGRVGSSVAPFPVATLAGAPTNPFNQSVVFSFPTPALTGTTRTDTLTDRLTLGLIAKLPWSWKAAADYTIGEAVIDQRAVTDEFSAAFGPALISGEPGPGGLPALNPLGDWQGFVAASRAYVEQTRAAVRLVDRFTDASLRLSGPAGRLPGGDLTLTVLAETRREHIPVSTPSIQTPDLNFSFSLPLRSRTVTSAYTEMRAPLTTSEAPFVLLRGLELQLAGRYDSTAITLPDNGLPGSPSNDRLVTLIRDAAVATIGARIFPLPELMLRASMATGALPPTISQLQQNAATVSAMPGAPGFPQLELVGPDPKRGNQLIGSEQAFTLLSNGSHGVKSEHGRTLAIGAVLDLSRRGGPRLSVDYSRITTHGEITDFPLTLDELVAAESRFPGRVLRAPLTAADAQLGFTGGPIILLDQSVINAGSAVGEAVDFEFDWRLPAGRTGDFKVYGSATWQPSFRRTMGMGQPDVSQVGFANGPLAWRANAGVEWSRGPLTVDFNGQYYDSYRVVAEGATDPQSEQILLFQGKDRFPAQVYFDLSARRRIELRAAGGPLSVLQVRFGVQNLFDQRPPIDADIDSQRYYSPYGDPRRRRMELGLSAQF